MNRLIVLLDEYTSTLINLNKLTLVLTNEDLKREFQVSDSTLNRLVKLSDFPNCWYGIRGHYSRDQVIDWYQNNDYEEFKEKMRILRSV
ncbi:DNA-binding protein [Enterococcus avium]|uniref:DNA-binding protein n=1 Tax=Enterococcus avium TaxID=33945 RepID=UPI00289220F5|nr:DNA-binding protein [Enterococcus avium]MDT2499363.1 DNA-binding protein [Enterococcus avium]